MSVIEYSLFRAKFIKSHVLFHDEITPKEIFLKAIEERPSAEIRKGYTWHIGNIQKFSDLTGYFAIGRTTKSSIEKFDEETRDFVDEELETSPYTHCVFNAEIGFMGIARKSNLAPTSKGIASKIEHLLGSTKVVRYNEITVEVPPIPDPDGFLNALSSAYRIFKFTASFRGPNPFDADEFFQKPLSVYLNAANGDKGKAQISGNNLDCSVVKQVSRSTAATGNEAAARIQKARGQKAITINLKGDPIKLICDESEHDPRSILQELNNLYCKVREDG